jgi:hypothetical protein
MSKASQQFSPIVQAMLAGTPAQPASQPRASLGDRIVDKAVDGLTATTHAVGQMSVAVDTVHFHDGVKKQKLRSFSRRQSFWQNIANQYNLTVEELSAIMAS